MSETLRRLKATVLSNQKWACQKTQLAEKDQQDLSQEIQRVWTRLDSIDADIEKLQGDKGFLEHVWGEINTVHGLVNQTRNILTDTTSKLLALEEDLNGPSRLYHPVLVTGVDRNRQTLARAGDHLGGQMCTSEKVGIKEDC